MYGKNPNATRPQKNIMPAATKMKQGGEPTGNQKNITHHCCPSGKRGRNLYPNPWGQRGGHLRLPITPPLRAKQGPPKSLLRRRENTAAIRT